MLPTQESPKTTLFFRSIPPRWEFQISLFDLFFQKFVGWNSSFPRKSQNYFSSTFCWILQRAEVSATRRVKEILQSTLVFYLLSLFLSFLPCWNKQLRNAKHALEISSVARHRKTWASLTKQFIWQLHRRGMYILCSHIIIGIQRIKLARGCLPKKRSRQKSPVHLYHTVRICIMNNFSAFSVDRKPHNRFLFSADYCVHTKQPSSFHTFRDIVGVEKQRVTSA